MLAPGAVVLTNPAAAQPAAAPVSPAPVPAGLREALSAWLIEGEAQADVPRTAAGLLDSLRAGRPALPPAPVSGWEAYFAALGTTPTPEEAAALRDFQLLHPHVSTEVEALAAEVARAQRMRDEAFSTLTDAQWALLPGAITLLSTGRPDALDADQLAAVSAVDLPRLVDAAAALARAAEDAPARLERAQDLDKALALAVPHDLRHRESLQDPARVIRAVAGGAAPVTTQLSLEEAVSGIALLSGLPEPRTTARILPLDVQAPLAALLVAHARELAGHEGAGLATLATIADQLPALTRAAHNLSLAGPGATATMNQRQRPLETVSVGRLDAPLRIVKDLYGVSAAPPQASFLDGLTRLADVLGDPLTPAELARARDTEAYLGPEFAAALGSLLAAQADYAEAASPASLAPVLALRAAAAPILDSSGPLTLGDIDVLRQSATAERALRERLGAATFSLTYAALDLPAWPAPQQLNAERTDYVELGPLLLLDDQSSVVDPSQGHFLDPYVLIVDLGGDDTYRIPVAGVSGAPVLTSNPGPNEARSAIAIDLGGRDHYEAVEDVSLGAARGSGGLPAFALLFDVRGDDVYVGRNAAGYGHDAVGMLVDFQGADLYEVRAGLGHASTSTTAAAAAGLLFDVTGNDRYVTRAGFGHLADPSPSLATTAFFLDVSGSDEYVIPCSRDESIPCFATPRPGNTTVSARGAAVFIDAHGVNKYPRPVDPSTTVEETETAIEREQENQANLTMGEVSDPTVVVDASRYAFAYDARLPHAYLDPAIEARLAGLRKTLDDNGIKLPPVNTYETLRDDDGDLIPTAVEDVLGYRGNDPTNPVGSSDDRDGDGFIDLLEELLGTRSDDPQSYPAGVPAVPAPLEDPGAYAPGPANFVVNLPGAVAIGGPGATRYADYYSFSVDLGFDQSEADTYLNATAANGHAIDLGGDDRYTPAAQGLGIPPALAVVNLEPRGAGALNSSIRTGDVVTGPISLAAKGADAASLIDLGGDDRYVAHAESLAAATGRRGAVALLLDAGGKDDYRALGGRSMGFAEKHSSAYFLDLAATTEGPEASADKYFAPTQGYNARPSGSDPGRVAFFLDAAGADAYDAGPNGVQHAALDLYQGRVQPLPTTVAPVTAGAITTGFDQPVAMFLDLGGADKYLVTDPGTSTKVDVADQKERRLRIDPVHGGSPSGPSIFYDTSLGDSDGDLHADPIEDAGGSDSRERTDAPVSASDGDFLVRLPRVGVVVGGEGINEYLPDAEFALQVDMGADDRYHHRVGASSIRFPVSLAIDVKGNDAYAFNGSLNLTDGALFRHARSSQGGMGSQPAGDAYPHFAAAQGAGLLGVGVLRDAGGDNTFALRAQRAPPCADCAAIAMGLGQGAGLLGVGVLALSGEGNNTFRAEAAALADRTAAYAVTHSQGAGIAGVGILADEDPRGRDTYDLLAQTLPAGNANLTTGQGYGLAGTGILLDSGGDNVFRAALLAQGVADGYIRTATPVFGAGLGNSAYDAIDRTAGVGVADLRRVRSIEPQQSVGQLLLPGVGNDRLTAVRMSQGFAFGVDAHALLLDAEGDDERRLAPTLQFPAAGLGQGAGIAGGTALLLDNRGRDTYVAKGDRVQGFGASGVGLLVDLSGADTYEAYTLAQGAVADQLAPPESERNVAPGASGVSARYYVRVVYPSYGVLLDRMGNDVYEVLPGARAQGSTAYNATIRSSFTGTTGDVETHVGAGLFVDAGGFDFYVGEPGQQAPVPRASADPAGASPVATAAGRPPTGNDWQWTVTADVVAQQKHLVGVGIDSDTITRAFADLTSRVGANQLTVPDCGDACRGTLRLSAALGASSARTGAQVDRAEFYNLPTYIGPGNRTGGGTTERFEVDFVSDALDEERIPVHPDGERTLQALLFVRAGTPDADGRRAALDVEPMTATQPIRIDNPPVARAPALPGVNHSTHQDVGTRQGAVLLDLRVDRDLERCGGGCPARHLGHFTEGADEWAVATRALGGTTSHDPSCTSGCAPVLTVLSGGGKAYITWTAPPAISPFAYRVVRETSGGPEPVAVVDARMEPRAFPGKSAPQYWLVDDEAADATGYQVHPVYLDAEGKLLNVTGRAAFTLNPAVPGPAKGLRALGVEGRVLLEWMDVPGATSYVVTRTAPHMDAATFTISPPVSRYEDTTVLADRDYTYTVVAKAGSTASAVASLKATARPSPGHTVTMTLQQGFGPEAAIPVLGPADFGGLQTHRVSWDASAIPDGEYYLNTTWTDGGGATTYNLSRVRLDGTAPATAISLPGNAGGAYLAGSTLRIPFTVAEGGSGVKRTAFWFKIDDEAWLPPVIVGPTASEVTFNGARDGMRLSVLAVSEDNVGNVEGIPAGRPWKNTLAEGFELALARKAYSTHVLDVSAPVPSVRRQEFVVRPGETVDFRLEVSDQGTGVGSVVAAIRDERIPLFPAGDRVFAGRWTAHGADGLIQLLVEMRDNAGNLATVSLGTVVVDATPPSVGEAVVGFTGGRLVGRPGETATLRVAATDAFVLEGQLNVTLDASNVSSTQTSYLRYDADARVYVGSFPVNRMLGTQANVTLDVRDGARNVQRVVLPVRLNSTATSLLVPTVSVSADRALINWTSADVVRSRVDHGLSPQLGSSTPLGPAGLDHSVLLAGLAPDTDYYAFAVGITDSGIETRSDLITFRTLPALAVNLTGVDGFPHSRGSANLTLQIVRYDAGAPQVDVEAWLNAPRGTPLLVGTASGVGHGGLVPLDLSCVRDGTYGLVLRARQAEMRGESAPRVFVVDRQAPMVTAPDARALGKGATFALQVDERGSGVDVSDVVWTFDGRRCAAQLAGDTLSCTVPTLNADSSTVRMSLRVPDRAGNEASLEMVLAVDSAAPVLSNHTLGGADGSAHLRPGAKARLRVDVQDLTVKLVEADLAPLGGVKTPMTRVGPTTYEAAFTVPERQPEGPVTILVQAIDDSNQVSTLTVSSAVDGTAPTLRRGNLVPQAPGEIMVVVESDEAVLARVKAAGPAGEIAADSLQVRPDHTLTLRGLRAGTPLRVAVTLVDKAGHETTVVLAGQALADSLAPTKVPNLRVEDRGDGRVVLRWDAASDNDGVAHYRVIRSVPGQASVTLPPVAGLLASDLVPVGVRVGYTVAAIDHAGNAGEVATAQVSSAAVPVLSGGAVNPPLGGPGLFTYSVDVTDASGTAPEVVVRVDGVAHPMTADKADCREGCRYTAVVVVGAETLASGPHEYSFQVVSGAFRVSHPDLDPLQGPTVLQGGDAPLAGGVLAAANRVPTGGVLLAALAVAGAVVAAVLLRRRKA